VTKARRLDVSRWEYWEGMLLYETSFILVPIVQLQVALLHFLQVVQHLYPNPVSYMNNIGSSLLNSFNV
jgi:hypothetical protein